MLTKTGGKGLGRLFEYVVEDLFEGEKIFIGEVLLRDIIFNDEINNYSGGYQLSNLQKSISDLIP